MSENKIAPAAGDAYELGEWMGRKPAFASLAESCSAATALPLAVESIAWWRSEL